MHEIFVGYAVSKSYCFPLPPCSVTPCKLTRLKTFEMLIDVPLVGTEILGLNLAAGCSHLSRHRSNPANLSPVSETGFDFRYRNQIFTSDTWYRFPSWPSGIVCGYTPSLSLSLCLWLHTISLSLSLFRRGLSVVTHHLSLSLFRRG